MIYARTNPFSSKISPRNDFKIKTDLPITARKQNLVVVIKKK